MADQDSSYPEEHSDSSPNECQRQVPFDARRNTGGAESTTSEASGTVEVNAPSTWGDLGIFSATAKLQELLRCAPFCCAFFQFFGPYNGTMSAHRWGAEGPPLEAYSRVTNPERFASLHDSAAGLLHCLECEFET